MGGIAEARRQAMEALANEPKRRITIELPESAAVRLEELARRCSATQERHDTSHGPLTVAQLLAMLAEDAALIINPDKWGAHREMKRVLQAHAYEV